MKLEDLNWGSVWRIIAIVLIFAAVTMAGIVIFAPKNVDYYYLGTPNGGSRSLGFCVYAHWTWHTDEIAYCTDDKDKAIEFVTKANATAIHKQER